MRQVHVIALTVLLVLPATAVAWGGRGHVEPSTTLDRTTGHMWQDTDTSAAGAPTYRGTRVYLNAFTGQGTGYVVRTGLNPNFATVQSERSNWPGNVAAMLGVWKDCNRDGMIGLGDNALLEYRQELLLDKSVCPAKPGFSYTPGTVAVHNDGVWILEFIPIGPNALAPNLDQSYWNIPDSGARVWADWGLPQDPPPASRCFVVFTPRGTFHSTGGTLHFLDCLFDWTLTDTWNSVAPDNTPLGQLSFRDKPRDQASSGSQLNRPNPYGSESDASAVEVFDCSQPQIARVPSNDPAATGVGVSRPKVPPTTSSSTSPAGTVNSTLSGLDDCNRSNNNGQWEGQVTAAPYSSEDPKLYDSTGVRTVSDFGMKFVEGTRPLGAGPLGRAFTHDQLRADPMGMWFSDARLAEDRNPYVNRASARGNVAMPVQNMTAYAFVSPGVASTYSLDLNPSSPDKVGDYGSEACGSDIGQTKVKNGWQCNPALWETVCPYGCLGNVDGSLVDMSVKVGQDYQLRDVDCYDASVVGARAVGAHWGILTGTRCV